MPSEEGRWLLEFADFHGLIDGVIGIADGRAGWRVRVACGDGKIAAGTIDGVGVTVALGARHAHGTGRDELLEGGTAAIDSDAVALGFGDLQEVHTHTGKADGLRWGSALGDRGHALEVQHVDADYKGGSYQ